MGDSATVEFIASTTTECFCCFNRLNFMHVWSNFCACYIRLQRSTGRLSPKNELRDSLLHWMLNLVEFFRSAESAADEKTLQNAAYALQMLPKLVRLMPHCCKSIVQPHCLAEDEPHGMIVDFRMDPALFTVPLLHVGSVADCGVELVYCVLKENRELQRRVAEDKKLALAMVHRLCRAARCRHMPLSLFSLMVALETIVACRKSPELMARFREARAVRLVVYALQQRVAPIIQIACEALMALLLGDQLEVPEDITADSRFHMAAGNLGQMSRLRVCEQTRTEALTSEVPELLVKLLALQPSSFRFFQRWPEDGLKCCGFIAMQFAVVAALIALCYAGAPSKVQETSKQTASVGSRLVRAGLMNLLQWPCSIKGGAAQELRDAPWKIDVGNAIAAKARPRSVAVVMLMNCVECRTASGVRLQGLPWEERCHVPEWRCVMRARHLWRGGQYWVPDNIWLPHIERILESEAASWGKSPASAANEDCWREVSNHTRFDWAPVVRKRAKGAAGGQAASEDVDSSWITKERWCKSEKQLLGDAFSTVLQRFSSVSLEARLELVENFLAFERACAPAAAEPQAPAAAGKAGRRADGGNASAKPREGFFDVKRALLGAGKRKG